MNITCKQNINNKPFQKQNLRTTSALKHSQVNFEGLTKALGSQAYLSVLDIKSKIENNPKSQGMVGNLPDEWVKSIPREKRKENIKDFYNQLSELVNGLRTEGQNNKNVKLASEKITEVMHENSMLPKETSIVLKKLGTGAFGTAYKLEEHSPDSKPHSKFVLKIFHNDGSWKNAHGALPEINRGTFWAKRAGKNTNRARFYFADAKSGYIVSQYIDQKTPEPKKYIPTSDFGIYTTDEGDWHNKIGGYSIEYGGMEIGSTTLASNKTARWAMKQICAQRGEKRNEVWSSLYSKAKNTGNEDLMAGVAYGLKALDFDNPSDRSKYLQELASSPSNKVKMALADSFSSMSDIDQIDVFSKIAPNADNNLKLVLLRQGRFFDLIGKDTRTKIINHFYKNSDEKVKVAVAQRLCGIMDEDALKIYDELAKKTSPEMKEILIPKLRIIPEHSREKYFKSFMTDIDKMNEPMLAQYLAELPGSKIIEYFLKLAQSKNPETREVLASNLPCLPKNDILKCLEPIVDSKEENVKKELVYVLSELNPKDAQNAFLRINKGASSKIKQDLAKTIKVLDDKDKPLCIKKLFANTTPATREKLNAIINKPLD